MKLIEPIPHKILYNPDRLSDFLRDPKLTMPISMELDLSDHCNLKCSWCRFADVHNPSIMEPDFAKRILSEFKDLGVKSVIYSGGGEPLLNPRADEIFKHATSLGLDQGIYTNGVFMNLFRVALTYMKFVYVSVDAFHPDTYEVIKGQNRRFDVLTNIKAFASIRGKTALGVGFLVDSTNYAQMKEFASQMQSYDVD